MVLLVIIGEYGEGVAFPQYARYAQVSHFGTKHGGVFRYGGGQSGYRIVPVPGVVVGLVSFMDTRHRL